jgi:hypothetical protein
VLWLLRPATAAVSPLQGGRALPRLLVIPSGAGSREAHALRSRSRSRMASGMAAGRALVEVAVMLACRRMPAVR